MIGRLFMYYFAPASIMVVLSIPIYFNEKLALEKHQTNGRGVPAGFYEAMPKAVGLPRCAEGWSTTIVPPPRADIWWRSLDDRLLVVEAADEMGTWLPIDEIRKQNRPVSALRFCAAAPPPYTRGDIAGSAVQLHARPKR